MQKLSFLPILTIAISAVSAVPQPPPEDQLPECVVDCFGTYMPELATCQDPTYVSCICTSDAQSKYPAIEVCLQDKCDQATADAIIQFLHSDICSPDEENPGPAVTVTATVTAPCTDQPEQPTDAPASSEDVTTVVPPGPTETDTPEQNTPPPPEVPTTTGVVPTPGKNATVTTANPTNTSPPVEGPPDDSAAAAGPEHTVALMGFLGILTFFLAL